MSKTMVVFDERTRSFRCAGCLGDSVPVAYRVFTDPEEFVLMRQRLEVDHAECPGYDNQRMALNARLTKIRLAREAARMMLRQAA